MASLPYSHFKPWPEALQRNWFEVWLGGLETTFSACRMTWEDTKRPFKGRISSSHPCLCFITFQYRYYISGHACIHRALSIRVRPFWVAFRRWQKEHFTSLLTRTRTNYSLTTELLFRFRGGKYVFSVLAGRYEWSELPLEPRPQKLFNAPVVKS